MKQRRWLTILRWVCVLPAVALSFVASIFLSMPMNPLLHSVLLSCGLISPSVGGFQFGFDWDGPLAAILFVLSGSAVAPEHRRVVALALFILGAFLTPGFLAPWNIQSTHLYPDTGKLNMFWPIAGTFTGGALAVACVFVATSQRKARSE
jgi:hypothetical protein